MHNLHLDLSSGISGDIMLAGLASINDNPSNILNVLSNVLKSILKKDISLSLEDVWRNSILCKRLKIDCDIEGEPFRSLNEIVALIDSANISDNAKAKSKEAFHCIAVAESKVHGIGLEEVHFHEIGAVDTIIDIVGTAYLIDLLKISKITSNIPMVGHGVVQAAHGLMPLPAPATLKILESVPLKRLDVEGELITPTGAAILKTFVSLFTNTFQGTLLKDSFSTGNLEFRGIPNMARFILLEGEDYINDSILKVETNIDNMSSEALGFLQNKLFEAGALDAIFSPAFFKKQRPGYILSVILKKSTLDTILNILFSFSLTIGVRISEENRIVLERSNTHKMILGFDVYIKEIEYNGRKRLFPEYESCKIVADKMQISIDEARSLILAELSKL